MFQGLDYYALDELLHDDERLVRDTFRRFVDEEVMPHIGKHFRHGTINECITPEDLSGRGCSSKSRNIAVCGIR